MTVTKELTPDDLIFIDNPAAGNRPARYLTVTVDVMKVLESWQTSLFSYEWMTPDGRLKRPEELSADEQPKRAAIEQKIRRGEALEKPVLGIGLLDNVEIGAGRAVFLTLAAMGATKIPVHIPLSNQSEFTAFLATS